MDTSGSTPPPPDHLSPAHGPAPAQAAGPGSDPAGGAATAVPTGQLPAVPTHAVPTDGAVAPGNTGHLLGALVLYTLLRFGLTILLAVVLMFFMPLIVAAMFAIVIQLPLSRVLFKGPRTRVNEAIAAASATRRAERSRLQAGLSGDAV